MQLVSTKGSFEVPTVRPLSPRGSLPLGIFRLSHYEGVVSSFAQEMGVPCRRIPLFVVQEPSVEKLVAPVQLELFVDPQSEIYVRARLIEYMNTEGDICFKPLIIFLIPTLRGSVDAMCMQSLAVFSCVWAAEKRIWKRSPVLAKSGPCQSLLTF